MISTQPTGSSFLHIEATCRPPAASLHCAGEIDASNVQYLRRALEAWVETGVAELEIDLRDVRYLDGETIQALVRAHLQIAEQGGTLRVRTRRRGARLLTRLGMDRVLNVQATRH
jgi:anti-anti-sigma factor